MDAEELHESKRKNVSIIYREYVHPKDYADVANINSSSLIVSFTYLYDEFHKKDPDLFIVAENENTNKILGFILVEKNPKSLKKGTALIYAIASHPGYKRLGIGSGLIRNIMVNLRYNHPKIKALYLTTWPGKHPWVIGRIPMLNTLTVHRQGSSKNRMLTRILNRSANHNISLISQQSPSLHQGHRCLSHRISIVPFAPRR